MSPKKPRAVTPTSKRRGRASKSAQRDPAAPAPAPRPDVERGAREKMVFGAARLLAQRGLQATSFSEVLAATDAPRGSIYHYFPNGKDQLIAAALELASEQMAKVLDVKPDTRADEVTAIFLQVWRTILTRSKLEAGCAVVAVTVATESSELLDQVGRIFRGWRARLEELLIKGGLVASDGARFAALLVSASEGAVVLSRAERSSEPFELVAEQLTQQARELLEKP